MIYLIRFVDTVHRATAESFVNIIAYHFQMFARNMFFFWMGDDRQNGLKSIPRKKSYLSFIEIPQSDSDIMGAGEFGCPEKKAERDLDLKSCLRLWWYISSILVLYLLCYNRFLFFEMLLNISAVNKNCVAISKRKLLKQHWKSCKKEHNKYFRIYTKHCHQITNTKFKQNMIVKLDTWQ